MTYGSTGMLGFPRWLSGKDSTCQYRRHRRGQFSPWVGRILWRRKWQPTPIFLPGKSHGQRSLMGYSSWDRRVRHDLVAGCTGAHALGTGMLRYLRSPHLHSAVFFAWNAFPSSNPSPLYIHPIQVCSGIPQQNSTDWVV